ncbi:MAG: hypothetical protein BIFFINMI_01110 [Phycisphaerae bacterium]|nr:hypothetical protein [Phycisphaerae bacterium]
MAQTTRPKVLTALTFLAAALIAPAAFAQPAIDRPDLPDGRLVVALQQYHMTELLAALDGDTSVDPQTASRDALLAEIGKKEGIARDARQTPDDRDKARDDANVLYGALISRFKDDADRLQWMLSLSSGILDGICDPISTRIAYEIVLKSELTRMAKALQQAQPAIEEGRTYVHAEMDKIGNLPQAQLRAAMAPGGKWQQLNAASRQFDYQWACYSFFRTQVVWAQVVDSGADPAKATQNILDVFSGGLKETTDFFGTYTRNRDLQIQAISRLHVGWAELFAGHYDAAIDQANGLLAVTAPAADPARAESAALHKDILQKQFQAYTLKARALRFKKQFGGTSLLRMDDIKDWQKICSDVTLAGARTGRSAAKRIWEKLTQPVQQLVKDGSVGKFTEQGKAQMLAGLNRLITDRDFYVPDDWRATPVLDREARDLAARGLDKLTDGQVQRINRLALEAAAPTALVHSQLGAMAVLRDQEAFIESTPELKQVDAWYAFNKFAVARTLVDEAAAKADQLKIDAENAERQNDKAAADRLRNEAGERAATAKSDARNLLQQLAKDKPGTKDMVAAMVDLIYGAANSGPVPDAPPTAEQLKAMDWYAMDREAERALNAGKYERSVAIYGAMAERATAETGDEKIKQAHLGKALQGLGQACVLWAQNLSAADKPKSQQTYLLAVGAFNRLLSEVKDYSQRTEVLRFLVNALENMDDKYTDAQRLDNLVDVLKLYAEVASGDELEQSRLWLGLAQFRKAENLASKLKTEGKPTDDAAPLYREAATTFGQMAGKGRYGYEASEQQAWSILKLYMARTSSRGLDPSQALGDLQKLADFADIADRRAADLRQQAESASGAEKQKLLTEADRVHSLGPDFKLEAGRLYYDAIQDVNRAIGALSAVRKDESVKPEVRTRAERYEVKVLLAAGRVNEAMPRLLALTDSGADNLRGEIMLALPKIEDEYKKLREQEAPEEKTRPVADLAHKLARAVVKEADAYMAGNPDKPMPPEETTAYRVHLARTYNWLGQYEEASKLLAPLYVPPPNTAPGQSVEGNFTQDPNFLIELADAWFHLGQSGKAVALYNQVAQTMRPNFIYNELWWRGEIGVCEGNLRQGKFIRESLTSLEYHRQKSDQLQKDPPQPPDGSAPRSDYALPAWLIPRYNKVRSELMAAAANAPTTSGPAAEEDLEDVASGPQGMSQGSQFGTILLFGGGAFVVLVGAYFVMLARAKRARTQRQS